MLTVEHKRNRAEAIGLLTRLRRRFASPSIVLVYHRVLPAKARDVNQLITTTDNFAAHLRYLREHASVRTPAQFVDQVTTRRALLALDTGPPAVLITFDDGYVDNFRHALPILIEHGCRALLFASTGHVGTRRAFWWDALETVVFSERPPQTGWVVAEDLVVPSQDPRSAYAALHRHLKPLPHEQRESALADLAGQGGVCLHRSDEGRPMDWEELQAWVAAGMSVGGHTCTHPQLAVLDEQTLQREITECKRTLEERLQTRADAFAYPFGTRQDFDARCEAAVRAAGFRVAFANWPGNARWARGPYALPRCLVRDWAVDDFAERFEEWTR